MKPGTLLHGFWPTTSTPTDLKLKASGANGLWIEISEHRQSLMPLYNRYSETATSLPLSELATSSSPAAKNELDRLAWSAFIVLKSGYYLSEHVFSPNPETQPPIHPLGSQTGLPWTSDDADLSSAAVVTLASSTKTARGFVSALQKRPKNAGPLGLLQVTSSVKSILEGSKAAESPFPSKAVEYSQIDSQEVVEWLKSFNASKIVIFNFGAGSEALERIQAVAKNDPALQSVKVVVILIGSEQKVSHHPAGTQFSMSTQLTIFQFLSPEEAKVAREALAGSSNILYNTSGIEDSLIQSIGLGPFFEKSNSLTKQMLDNRHNLPGKLVWGRGVSGATGIEGAWERLSQAQVDADEYLVYQVQQ